jgi:hypothetical protein
MKTERFEYVEVDVTSKFELRDKENEGWAIYGVSRDLRQDHPSFLKLRRAVEKGKK